VTKSNHVSTKLLALGFRINTLPRTKAILFELVLKHGLNEFTLNEYRDAEIATANSDNNWHVSPADMVRAGLLAHRYTHLFDDLSRWQSTYVTELGLEVIRE
jgi:hypothetical protein